MSKKLLWVALAAVLTTGCASNSQLYDWGQYEQTLFISYHEPEYKEKAIQKYITFIREHQGINAQGTNILAPGLCAEAGTFMLEKGDFKNAIVFYKMEYELWPESRPMLGILIKNLEARL